MLNKDLLNERPDLVLHGIFFGYPSCCINSFVANFGTPDNASRFDVSNNTGFVPCEKHAQMIRNNECTLESLVDKDKRLCEVPFPNTCNTSFEEIVQRIMKKYPNKKATY